MIFDLFDSPELLDIQRAGFYRFLNQGIPQLLAKEFPIKVKNGSYSIHVFINEKDVKLIAPEDDPRDCILKMKTYSCKLYAQVQIVCKKSSGFSNEKLGGEIPCSFGQGFAPYSACSKPFSYTKGASSTNRGFVRAGGEIPKIVYQSLPEWIFLGQLPMMTKRGHFIINGSPRVIVHQVVRAPGIYFQKLIKKDDQNKTRFYGDIIPLKGVWVRLQMTKKGRIEVKFKKGKKVELEFLQKCLQVIEDQTSLSLEFSNRSFETWCRNTLPVPYLRCPGGASRGTKSILQSDSKRFLLGKKKQRHSSKCLYRQAFFNSTTKLKSCKKPCFQFAKKFVLPFSENFARLRVRKNNKKTSYDNCSNVFEKRKTRAESKAEHNAFIHTYDRLYRTTQDKELEEWQKKKKNLSFFKGSSSHKNVASKKSSFCKKGCTLSNCKTKNVADTYLRARSCRIPMGQGDPRQPQYTARRGGWQSQKEQNHDLTFRKANGFRSLYSTENDFKRKKCSENLFATFKMKSRYDLGVIGREKINNKFGLTRCVPTQYTARHAPLLLPYTTRAPAGQKGVNLDFALFTRTPYLPNLQGDQFGASQKEGKQGKQGLVVAEYGKRYQTIFPLKKQILGPPVNTRNKVFRNQEILLIDECNTQLTALDLCSASFWLHKLRKGEQNSDDIDHSQNRRVRTSGDLLQTQFENGVDRLKNVVSAKLQERRGGGLGYSIFSSIFKISYKNRYNLGYKATCPYKSSICTACPCPCPCGAKGAKGAKGIRKGQRFFLKEKIRATFSHVEMTPFVQNLPKNVRFKTNKGLGVSYKVSTTFKPFLGFSNVTKNLFSSPFSCPNPCPCPCGAKGAKGVKASRERARYFGTKKSVNFQSNHRKWVANRTRMLGCKEVVREETKRNKKNVNTRDILLVKKRFFAKKTSKKEIASIQPVVYRKFLVSKRCTCSGLPYNNLCCPALRVCFGFKGEKKFLVGLEKDRFSQSRRNCQHRKNWSRLQDLETVSLYKKNSYKDFAKELFSTKPITGALREFFGSNPLSQYMDQTNPLAEITHKRRISSLGIGGVSRESAGMAIRGIHPTHYGRICPIETPEGKNAGLVNSLAFYTKIDINGFLKTPYYRVFKGQIQSSLGFSFCSAKEESLTSLQIAPSDLQKSWNNILRTRFSTLESVPVRVTDNLLDVFKKENPYKVELIAISPIQMISVATSLIPFLEHNDANRALMGSNMQRQAVPLMISERPVVGTGLESNVIVESGHITESKVSGFASHVTANKIVIDTLEEDLRKKVFSSPFSYTFCPFCPTGARARASSTNLRFVRARYFATKKSCISCPFHFFKFKRRSTIAISTRCCNLRSAKKSCNSHFLKSKVTRFSNQNKKIFTRFVSISPLRKNKISANLKKKRFLLRSNLHLLTTFSRSNQNTCITEKPLVREFDWVQKGDVLTDSSASNNGELAVGKNVLVAYIPWEGYNFEDAIVISERLVKEHVYTSLHIERYVFQAQDLKDGNEWFTKDLPGVEPRYLHHLEESGLPKIGSFLKEGDILVGKTRYLNKKPASPYERLLCDILGEKNFSARNKSLYVPKGIEARVVYHKVINVFENSLERKQGVMKAAKTVHLFLGEKRVIQVGDKISGRHGNKGVISTILPRQDMPYLPDGTPIDLILNPLGVPSRMNVGQVLECLLGLAASYLNQHFKIAAFDERYGVEASKGVVFLKLYQARLQSGQNWLFQVTFPGKTRLIDGRSGECFDQWITVGKAYILKLIHMVSEKIHARSTGPYALITQQPLRGRSNKGGQRLGEMEVWALEGFGAAYTLQELLTKKSDDFFGRKQIVDSILPNPSSIIDVLKSNSRVDLGYKIPGPFPAGKGQSKPVLGHPEIFKVLLCELQALCLDLGIYVLTPESFQRTFLGVVH